MIPFGAYFTTGSYGDNWKSTGFYSLWRNSLYTTSDEIDAGRGERQRIDIERAGKSGKKLLVAFEYGFYPRAIAPKKTIKQFKKYWDQVVACELADEPKWSVRLTQDVCAEIRDEFDAQKLEHKPLGLTFADTKQFKPEMTLDYAGVEAYLPAPGPHDSISAEEQVINRINQQVSFLPENFPIILILQSYTSAWGNEDHLQGLYEMQRASFDWAYQNKERVLAIIGFSYGRPSGILDHPELRLLHKQLAKEHEND